MSLHKSLGFRSGVATLQTAYLVGQIEGEEAAKGNVLTVQ